MEEVYTTAGYTVTTETILCVKTVSSIAFYVICFGIIFMAICGAKLTKDVDICNCV